MVRDQPGRYIATNESGPFSSAPGTCRAEAGRVTNPGRTTSPLPEFEGQIRRKIAGILRSRLARDMAIARSQDSSDS